MADLGYLKGKTGIITGAAGGIGTSLSSRFASYGMNLLLVGRDKKKLEALREKLLGQYPVSIRICPGDLTDISSVERIAAAAEEEFSGADVLVNNAGMAQHASVEEVTEDFFDEIMALNVRAPFFLCQKMLPLLRKSECGTILNICSVVAHKGYPMQSAYAASKHALLGFSKSLANEVYDQNIRVHVISPGGVYTPMVSLSRPDLTPEGMILPEDIADLAEFYLSMRESCAVVDEIQVHRVNKAPFA